MLGELLARRTTVNQTSQAASVPAGQLANPFFRGATNSDPAAAAAGAIAEGVLLRVRVRVRVRAAGQG